MYKYSSDIWWCISFAIASILQIRKSSLLMLSSDHSRTGCRNKKWAQEFTEKALPLFITKIFNI